MSKKPNDGTLWDKNVYHAAVMQTKKVKYIGWFLFYYLILWAWNLPQPLIFPNYSTAHRNVLWKIYTWITSEWYFSDEQKPLKIPEWMNVFSIHCIYYMLMSAKSK